jgi:hypothetical protein
MTLGSGRAMKAPIGFIGIASGQILVVDRGIPTFPGASTLPAAVMAIDSTTGNRAVISGCVDTDCVSTLGSGPPLTFPNPGAIASDGTLLVMELDLNAVLRVDPITGNRSVVSGCTDAISCGGPPVGSGPAFNSPVLVKLAADGDLLVTDFGLPGVMHVDPATGNRTVITSASMGTGPAFQAPAAPVDLPEPRTIPALAVSMATLALLATRRRSGHRR